MRYPALHDYIQRLASGAPASSSLRLADDGEVQGHIFNTRLGSEFHPLQVLGSGEVAGYAGRVRPVAVEDRGLPLWKILDGAAGDNESVELDRLARMLHAINFFRRADAGKHTLYLNVHDRLLSAVSSNHGMAFRRILDGLELPVEQVVLQLPAVNARQNWMLNYVADNYRRNGFRIAVKVATPSQVSSVLGHAAIDAVRIVSLEGATPVDLTHAFGQAAVLNVDILLKESAPLASSPDIAQAAARTGARILIQSHRHSTTQQAA
jgi:hypothetical protein